MGTHHKQSELLANQFCIAYERAFNVCAKPQQIEGGDVDAIIAIDGEEVGLEFTAYEQRDAFHESEEPNAKIERASRDALSELGLQCSLTIYWRDEPRRKTQRRALSSDRVVLPRHDEQKLFLDELQQFCIQLQKREFRNSHVFFVERLKAEGDRYYTNSLIGWACNRFPTLSRYCRSIRYSGSLLPSVRTSFRTRHANVDELQLSEVIRNKNQKRYGAFGRPVWLILYSDWVNLSRRLPPPCRSDAMRVIRDLVDRERFVHVWWMEFGSDLFDVYDY